MKRTDIWRRILILLVALMCLGTFTLMVGCGRKGNEVLPDATADSLSEVIGPQEQGDSDAGQEIIREAAAVLANGFDFPVGDAPNAQDGYNWYIYSGQHFNEGSSTKSHLGEDWNRIGGDLNYPVYAIATGVLAAKEWVASGGWKGYWVAIQHTLPGNISMVSCYAHMAQSGITSKKVGDTIYRHDQIGLVGDYPDGPHLHFEMRWGTYSAMGSGYSSKLTAGVLHSTQFNFEPTDLLGNNRNFSDYGGGVVIFNDKFDTVNWFWGTQGNTNRWSPKNGSVIGYDLGGVGYWQVTSSFGYPASCLRFGGMNGTDYGSWEGGSGHPEGKGQTWGDVAETVPIWVPAGTTKLKLTFNEHYSTEYDRDFCSVDLVNHALNANPSKDYAYNAAEYSGSNSGWQARTVELTPALTTFGDYVKIRFRFRSNGTNHYNGWMVDNIRLIANATGQSGNPPAPPTNVQASKGTYTDRIRVSWITSSSATSYNIYRATSQSGTYGYLNTTFSAYYEDWVSNTNNYWYKVSAVNSYGESSLAGPDYGYKKASGSVPPTPAGLTASDGYCGYIYISWSPASGATQYQLYRATSSSGPFTTPYKTLTSTYYYDYPGNSATYWYAVKGTNSYGSSGLSNIDSGYAAVTPSAPSNVQASDGSYADKIRITWTGSTGATKYYVYRATSQNGSYGYIGYSSGTSLDDYPGDTSTYWYKVSAYNSCGESAQAGPNSGYRGSSGSTPPPPTNVQASDGTYVGYVFVSWSESPGAAKYYVYRATSQYGSYGYVGSAYGGSLNDYPGDTSTYWYKVSAVVGDYESPQAGPDSGWKGHGSDALWWDSVTPDSWSLGWQNYNVGGPYSWYLEEWGVVGYGSYSFRMGPSDHSNNDYYGNYEDDHIYGPGIWIPPHSTNVRVIFNTRYRTEPGDYCYVNYHNGSSWVNLGTYSGWNAGSPNWIQQIYYLNNTGEQGQWYKLEFRFTSNGSGANVGWQVDEILVTRG